MMSLVNVSLKLWSLNMIYMLIFLMKKMWVAFAFATHIFFSKNTCELDTVLTRTVNILTIYELVKLTILWTTGPRTIITCISKGNSCSSKFSVNIPLILCFSIMYASPFFASLTDFQLLIEALGALLLITIFGFQYLLKSKPLNSWK